MYFHEAIQQAVKTAISDLIITGTTKTEKNMKDPFYQYTKVTLAAVVKEGTLDEVFDRNINRWIQAALLIEASTCQALN